MKMSNYRKIVVIILAIIFVLILEGSFIFGLLQIAALHKILLL
jgi:hypothetical protein